MGKNNTSDPIIKIAFWSAMILIVVIIIISFYISKLPSIEISNVTPSMEFTDKMTLLPNVTLIPQVTKTTTPLFDGLPISEVTTPSPFPTPIIGIMGTNLPPNFYVGPWRDNYEKCRNEPEVKIQGVAILNGDPPYQFTFWQGNKKISPTINEVTSSETYFEFVDSVSIYKGQYVHVVITFKDKDNKAATWIDDIYYPYPNFYDC